MCTREFFDAYITTALWSSTDDDGNPLDADYGREDLAPATLEAMKKDCDTFYEKAGDFFYEEYCLKYGPDFGIDGRAGHDFWLTRNGHGAGFWDSDWNEEAGKVLTELSKTFREVDLYIGDDGLIYSS
jgi:hypothetical protein